jgi:hypothetical protein
MINASSTQKIVQDNYASLNFGTAAEIIQQVDLLYTLLLQAGIPARPYTPKSVQILSGLEETRKKNILRDLKNWSHILMTSGSSLENVDERSLAGKALKYFNFKLKDHNWEETHLDEIIEIYNPEGIQLYRSLNFFKTCGYSLLDLCVNEWFILWERPRSVVEKMHAVVGTVLNGKKQDFAMNVGPHLIRETYDDGMTQPFAPRAAIVEFKNIYPAYGRDYTDIIGFMVTSKGKLVSIGDDAMKVDFI